MTAATMPTEASHLPRLIQMAEAMGCQLRPQQNNPRIMRGLCPFHASPRLHSINTLVVNTLTGHFQCQRCQTQGNPASFVARCWGVTIAEANKMIERLGPEPITSLRPTPIALQDPDRHTPPTFRIQNSYLLTQATEFYEQELNLSLKALSYLARLGITQERADACRIGYAKGWGLREHLNLRDVSNEEIDASPLFRTDRRANVVERYHDIITIPDLDRAQATRWILALPPVAPKPGQPWPARPPQALPLNGHRPFLFGLGSTGWNEPRIAITDDPRIILVMQDAEIPVCHTIGRQEPEKIAQRLMDKHPRLVAIAFQDQPLGDAIAAAIAEHPRPPRIVRYNTSWISAALEPATRVLTSTLEA